MKLFVTNKEYFDNYFKEVLKNSKGVDDYYTSHKIHKLAFSELSKKIDIDNAIPLLITTDIGYNRETLTMFEFETKKGDIYYYSFQGTVS